MFRGLSGALIKPPITSIMFFPLSLFEAIAIYFLFAIAFRSYYNSRKSDNYIGRNKEKSSRTKTKNKAKRLRATTFIIAKFKER